MAEESMTLLEVKDLCTRLRSREGTVYAVNHVSFSLHKGEIFGLVGESGCGKSTVLRTILRLYGQQAEITGEILYKDQDIVKLKKKELRKIRGKEIGMIFQEPMVALNPVLKIKTQIYEQFLGRKLSGKEKKEAAIQALKQVEIPYAEKRVEEYIHQFSGGMRQRSMIATALAAQSQILLADEPTTALDVTIQAQIMKLLRMLRRDLGTTIVLVTHDLGVVSQTCDRVAVMYAGRIVEMGEAGELFSKPMHPYTQGLLSALPQGKDKDVRLETIGGAPPDLKKETEGCPFAPRCRYATEQCRTAYPERRQFTDTHFAYCWRDDAVKEEECS